MLIRYPGSKAKIAHEIVTRLPVEAQFELWSSRLACYCEPFFGSGAIGWQVLGRMGAPGTQVIVNDLDYGIACLWRAVRDDLPELVRMIRAFQPTAKDFYAFKEADGDRTIDPLRAGFRKLALHQISFSGLGYKAGGPLGGRGQRSKFPVGCRYNREALEAHARGCHAVMRRFDRFDIHNEDFADTLRRVPRNGICYLDPPYYVQGPALYRHAMDDADHERLAAALRGAAFRWFLSYDDCRPVRDLYSWAAIEGFQMTPTVQTVNGGKRRKNSEVIISNARTQP